MQVVAGGGSCTPLTSRLAMDPGAILTTACSKKLFQRQPSATSSRCECDGWRGSARMSVDQSADFVHCHE